MVSARTALLAALGAAVARAAPSLQAALNSLALKKAQEYNCSIAIAVRDGRGNAWEAVGGISDFATGRKASVNDPFALGSVTKTFTGPGVFQLVDQGVWTLDQPVAPLVDPLLHRAGRPGLAEKFGDSASRITLYHLLHMTSGLPDYDTSWDRGDPWRFMQYRHAHHDYTPLEILDKVNGTMMFEPGEAQFYTSTGYVVLGLALAEHYGAKTWDKFDQGSVIPQHLRREMPHVRFALKGPCSKYTQEHGYDRMGPPVRPVEPLPTQGRDVWDVSCLGGWTAGNVLGPVSEIAAWTEAVYGGSVLSPEMKKVMRDTSANHRQGDGFYGAAAFNLTKTTGLPLPEGEAWGHLGSTYGYQSIVVHFEATNATIVVASNLEIREQSQPSDVVCFSYHMLLSHLAGKKMPKCTYVSTDYFFGNCTCVVPESEEEQETLVV